MRHALLRPCAPSGQLDDDVHVLLQNEPPVVAGVVTVKQVFGDAHVALAEHCA